MYYLSFFFARSVSFFFFFFQAEDGIRDIGVTGVQTCALPIYRLGENPQTLSTTGRGALVALLPAIGICVVIASGFAPAALTFLAALSEEAPQDRGAIMGLYSLLLGGGQLLGTWIGGIFADIAGFNGLIVFSLFLTGVAFWSVQISSEHLRDRPRRLSGSFKRINR